MSRSAHCVIFAPDWGRSNPYQAKLAAGVESQGIQVTLAAIGDSPLRLNRLLSEHPDAGVLHLHWLQELLGPILWSGGPGKHWLRVALLVVDCLLCRARGVTLVWTVHNLLEHESLARQRELDARRLLFRLVHRVIVHSDGAAQEVVRAYGIRNAAKLVVIPHGNYVGDYREDAACTAALRYALGESEEWTLTLLFFGAVRPYKGVERLVSALRHTANPALRLIIAGRIQDAELERWLRDNCSADARIHLRLGFVPKDEVASYFALADAVVLPFERTLTSGSVLLAMSMGRALILPEDARLLDLPGDEGALYFADGAALQRVLEGLDAAALSIMGRQNLQAATELDWERIGALTVGSYHGGF